MNKVTVATDKDNTSNMIAAFRNHCCRLSCFAHCLNLVVNDTISVKNSQFQALMIGRKNLVRHFKHTGLQRKLSRTLKQECPTRLNSTYLMLESMVEQYDLIHGILEERSELLFLYAVDQDLLKEVSSFLKHFKSASEMDCCDSKPTLHLVAPVHHRLVSAVCANSDENCPVIQEMEDCSVIQEMKDCPVIQEMKVKGKAALESKVRLDPRHNVAAFLSPVMKGLVFKSPGQKRIALETVTKYCC